MRQNHGPVSGAQGRGASSSPPVSSYDVQRTGRLSSHAQLLRARYAFNAGCRGRPPTTRLAALFLSGSWVVSSRGCGCGVPPARVNANGGRKRRGTPPTRNSAPTRTRLATHPFLPLLIVYDFLRSADRILEFQHLGFIWVTPPLTRSSSHASYGATLTRLH